MDRGAEPGVQDESIESLVHELRLLRVAAGVSYRELATRITRRREADGQSAAAARIAHSTVSDVFASSRSRINLDLMAEIVAALGGDDVEADRWRSRMAAAMATSGGAPAHPAPAIVDATATLDANSRARAGTTVARIAVVVIAGLLLNATGKFLNPLAGDLLFLDMIGTAMVAILAGPLPAALVGVLFIGVEVIKGEFGDALFAVTMVTSGIIWGVGVERFGLGKTLPRFLALSAVVAVTTTALALPIIVLYLGGATGRGDEGLAAMMTAFGADLWVAAGAVNLPVSLVDKLLTGAIAFVGARWVVQLTAGSSRAPSLITARNR